MIDRTALLATLKPVVTNLEDSIRERALSTPEVTEHLELEHSKAVKSDRTAMSLEEWREGEITQAAVAWVLGCVFVRFLEDNRLIDQPLIAGPGQRGVAALGHRSEYFQREPGNSDREYLESCFREVAAFPAVAALYDERHNPLWRLGPTADGARTLRETFTRVDPGTGELLNNFADSDLDTRFLGDLYQDLSEAAKKRYALLQTPDFVERFILDRTLTPAIEEFGLETVRLIDPTCGSGHFLIGAFERLFALWGDREPATESSVIAQRCLDHIAGVDLNPYATAIARFRLLVAALRACGISRLAASPAFTLNLATGDSLLHGPLPSDGATMLFDAGRLTQNIAHVYESEDASELKRILGRGYHAVVGNPPYIAVQDNALRDAYRRRYAMCHGHYVLTVPFMERFFELAQVPGADRRNGAGFVGKITGNNFMKRDFGAPLVESFLASQDVHAVIDASGAYIPGHGTPTILLFARSRRPALSTLRVLDGVRGEPKQPDDPAQGLVWSAIEQLVDEPGRENAFVRASDTERRELFVHPMTLGIGRSLLQRVERDRARLDSRVETVGFGAVTREDDVYDVPAHVARARGISETNALVGGGDVRDWLVATPKAALWPYNPESLSSQATPRLERFLWPWKRQLSERVAFGKNQIQRGLEWFEYSMFFAARHRGPTIAWAFVATHNHFVLDLEEKVFNRTAPVIKLRKSASLEDHLELLGPLNTSVAAFWFRQVCQNRGSTVDSRGARQTTVPWEDFVEIPGARVAEFPLPSRSLRALPQLLHSLALERAKLMEGLDTPSTQPLLERLASRKDRERAITAQMVSLQEELDWQALAAYGLVPGELAVLGDQAPPIVAGERAFEIALARQVVAGETETTWFERHGAAVVAEIPAEWPAEYREVVERRIDIINSDADVALVERPEHKRRWNRAPWDDRQRQMLTTLVLDALEDPVLWADLRPRSTAELTDYLRRTPSAVDALDLLADRKDADLGATVNRLVLDVAVPHLAAQRFTEKGVAKRAVWERVWDFQRAEDRGEVIESIPLPPKYAQVDFRSGAYWKQRGRLDVPKERFVLIPNAERGADTSPVVGWAGWDERDLARALAGRITELRDQDAADAERVTPLLAGVLELLPWIYQWNPDSDPLYAGPPGVFFENWLDGQLAELAITRETLRAWRPPATRGRKAKVADA